MKKFIFKNVNAMQKHSIHFFLLFISFVFLLFFIYISVASDERNSVCIEMSMRIESEWTDRDTSMFKSIQTFVLTTFFLLLLLCFALLCFFLFTFFFSSSSFRFYFLYSLLFFHIFSRRFVLLFFYLNWVV